MLVDFITKSGAVVHLNIHPSIPFGLTPNSGGDKVILAHPTHNNGGYVVVEPMAKVVAKINRALAEERP